MPDRSIEEVLSEYTPRLMKIPGVVGTYQGECDSRPCIKVMVVRKTPEIERRIPREIEGYRVEIEVSGEIRAFPESRD